MEQALCERSYLAAMFFERDGDFANARTLLAIAGKGKPEWLAPHGACRGLTGTDLLRSVQLRLRLYRSPALFAVWRKWERLRAEIAWRWLWAIVRLHGHLRLLREMPVGDIHGRIPGDWRISREWQRGTVVKLRPARGTKQSPNPVPVVLEWSSAGTVCVEVRLGRPDGPVIGAMGTDGTLRTGAWVEDGTRFFLQDTSNDPPLTLRHTLAVIRVKFG